MVAQRQRRQARSPLREDRATRARLVPEHCLLPHRYADMLLRVSHAEPSLSQFPTRENAVILNTVSILTPRSVNLGARIDRPYNSDIGYLVSFVINGEHLVCM